MSLLSLFAVDLFADAPFFLGDAAVDVDDLCFVEVLSAAALPSLRQFQGRAGEQRAGVFIQSPPFGDDAVELLPPEQEFTVFLNPALQSWPVAQQVVAELCGGLSGIRVALDCHQRRGSEIVQDGSGRPRRIRTI